MELSVGAVFGAGLLTFASPCVLPLVPIYLGLLSGGAAQDLPPSRWRPLLSTALFSLGFGLVFSLLGLSATAVGGLLLRNKLLFQQVGGIVILLLGLRFMGYLQLPFLGSGKSAALDRFQTRFHYLNAFILGLLFAFAWSPCIGSVLGAVLTYTSLKTSSAAAGMGYLATYSLGFALPLLAVAAFAGPALAWLKKTRRFIPIFEKATGVLLIVVGFLMVTDRLSVLDFPSTNGMDQNGAVAAIAKGMRQQATGTLAGTKKGGAGAHAGATGVGATCGAGGDNATGVCAPGEPQPMATILEFYSPGCSICRQMIPVVAALKSACEGKSVRIVPINVTSVEGRPLARKYGVRGIPVFVFVDKEGHEISRLVGFQHLSTLRQATAALLGESCPYREVPGLQGGAKKPPGKKTSLLVRTPAGG